VPKQNTAGHSAGMVSSFAIQAMGVPEVAGFGGQLASDDEWGSPGLTGGIDKVPDRGSPSRSTSEQRGSFFADGCAIRTGHAAARRAAVRHFDFVHSPAVGEGLREFRFSGRESSGRIASMLCNPKALFFAIASVFILHMAAPAAFPNGSVKSSASPAKPLKPKEAAALKQSLIEFFTAPTNKQAQFPARLEKLLLRDEQSVRAGA